MPKKKNKKPSLFETFTKLWVSILLIIGIVDLQLSYLLAFLGYDQIAETLSVAVVTEILGVTVAYIVRAFFDTKDEKKQDLEERKFEYEKTMNMDEEVESSNSEEGEDTE